jgi:hypothetical protein
MSRRKSPSREELLERQRNGLCLSCGSRNHKAAVCPRKSRGRPDGKYRQGRPPSPSQKGKGQRVNFRVSEVHDDPPTSVREGDDDDDEDEDIGMLIWQ